MMTNTSNIFENNMTNHYSMLDNVDAMWLRGKFHFAERLINCAMPFFDISLQELDNTLSLVDNENSAMKSLKKIIFHLNDEIVDLETEINKCEIKNSEELNLKSESINHSKNAFESNVNSTQTLDNESENIKKYIKLLIDVNDKIERVINNNSTLDKENQLRDFDLISVIEVIKEKVDILISKLLKCDNNITEEDMQMLSLKIQQLEAENIVYKNQINDFEENIKNLEQCMSCEALRNDLEAQIDDCFQYETQLQQYKNNESQYETLLTDLISKISDKKIDNISVLELIKTLEVIIDQPKLECKNVASGVDNDNFENLNEVGCNTSEILYELEESLKTEIENFKLELSDTKRVNELNIEELKDKDKKINNLTKEIHDISQQFQESIEKLEKFRDSTNTAKTEQEEIIKMLEEEIDVLRKDLFEAEEKIKLNTELVSDYNEKSNLIEIKDEKITDLNNELQSSLDKCESLMKVNSEIESELEVNSELIKEYLLNITDMENQIKSLQSDLENEKIKTDLKEEELNDLKKDINCLDECFENLLKGKNDITAELVFSDELVSAKELNVNKIETYKKFAIEINNLLVEKDEEIKQLKFEAENLQNKTEIMESTLKMKINGLEEEYSIKCQEFTVLSVEIENLKKINKEIESENVGLKINFENNQTCLKDLSVQLETVNTEMNRKEKEYLESSNEFNIELTNQKLTIENLTKEKLSLLEKSDENLALIKSYDLKLTNLSEERSNLEIELNQKEQFHKEMLENFESINLEKTKLTKMLSESEEKINTYKNDYESLENCVMKLKVDFANCQEDLKSISSSKESIENDYKQCQLLLREKEDLIIKQIDQLDNADKNNEKMQTQLIFTNDELVQVKLQLSSIHNDKEVETLKTELNNKDEQLKESEHQCRLKSNELVMLKKENDSWNQKIKDTYQELHNARKKYKKDLDAYKNKIDGLEMQLNDQAAANNHEEIEKLNSTIESLNETIAKKNKEIDEYGSLVHHYKELKVRYIEKRTIIKQQEERIAFLEEHQQA